MIQIQTKKIQAGPSYRILTTTQFGDTHYKIYKLLKEREDDILWRQSKVKVSDESILNGSPIYVYKFEVYWPDYQTAKRYLERNGINVEV